MPERIYNVLFLCTGNSARSIMAECALNRWGRGRFEAFSAGSHPKGEVHPLALELLRAAQLPDRGAAQQELGRVRRPGAPPLDFVFTVCDNAAGEVCPVWPGQPMTAHWGVQDPAAFVGPPRQAAAPASATSISSSSGASRSSRACRSPRSTS